MSRNTVQRWAFAALISLIILIFIGAIVRVTGAGLGCPDWPTCWGKIIPPTSVEQVDFDKLDIERFQKRAESLGRDPDTITRESLHAEFNTRHTWTEFLNRLASFPITFTSLGLAILGFRKKHLPRRIRLSCYAAFFLVMSNALLGALVVLSRLHTGIITTHMALAFILIGVLVYIHWAGGDRPTTIPQVSRRHVAALLGLVIFEGLMGSQIRELTDVLQLSHTGEARSLWIHEIETSAVYLIHRSFSWLIFFWTLFLFWKSKWRGTVPTLVMTLVTSLMLMGLILSQIGIVAVVQILHVGVSAILTAVLFHWWLAAPKKTQSQL